MSKSPKLDKNPQKPGFSRASPRAGRALFGGARNVPFWPPGKNGCFFCQDFCNELVAFQRALRMLWGMHVNLGIFLPNRVFFAVYFDAKFWTFFPLQPNNISIRRAARDLSAENPPFSPSGNPPFLPPGKFPEFLPGNSPFFFLKKPLFSGIFQIPEFQGISRNSQK